MNVKRIGHLIGYKKLSKHSSQKNTRNAAKRAKTGKYL